ncbi:MAG TPA: hypothetical protein VJU85_07820 [Nitrososphaeraceae archaeon]|nr:hypothetical protein [Nitrososphaeraceae archaeon]
MLNHSIAIKASGSSSSVNNTDFVSKYDTHSIHVLMTGQIIKLI